MVFLLSACQVISPIFVNYNGVRMDVAKWINHQPFMTMQQKRSLVELSKAQQKLKRFPEYDHAKQLEITKQNQIAMYCAERIVTEHKIKQLQHQIYAEELDLVLGQYNKLAPKIPLESSQIKCD